MRGELTRTPGRWARPIGWFLAHVVWRTEVIGRENLPIEGPVVIAANHTGLMDGPLVFAVAQRPVHMLVKASMFRGPMKPLLLGAGQIPVNGQEPRAALTAAMWLLQSNSVVGLFPEGSRGRGDLTHTRAGAAWLALNADARVVPVAVLGTRRTGQRIGAIPGFRRRIVIEFGPPISVARAPGTSGKQALEAANARIRHAILNLLTAAVSRTGMALPDDVPGTAFRRGGRGHDTNPGMIDL